MALPDLNALEEQLKAAENTADISELTAQILVHVAAQSGEIATKTGTSADHLKELVDKTGTSADHLKDLVDKTGTSADHLKDLVDKTGTSADHLKDLVDKTGTSAANLKTLADKAVESARHQDTIATALQAVTHRGAQDNPLHVTFEHPGEFKVSLHEETLNKIVAVWTGGDRAVDGSARRELLDCLLRLRNAVKDALAETRRPAFEEATRWLEDEAHHHQLPSR
jgi:uncharacterized phage infection (PIP) family protein YhgE